MQDNRCLLAVAGVKSTDSIGTEIPEGVVVKCKKLLGSLFAVSNCLALVCCAGEDRQPSL